jgi:hypothetical protein
MSALWTRLVAWLKAKLTNSWMNNPEYGFFMAHSGWAFALLVSAAYLSHTNIRLLEWVTAGGFLAAALKEYVYDALFEVPKQTFTDNTEDFVGYLVGLAIGWCVLFLGSFGR